MIEQDIQTHTPEEIRKREYEEWLQNINSVLESTDVDFIHEIKYERRYEEKTSSQGQPYFDSTVVKVLVETYHIDDIHNAALSEMIEDEEIHSTQDGSYYRVIDSDICLPEWLQSKDHEVADDYEMCEKYDYNTAEIASKNI